MSPAKPLHWLQWPSHWQQVDVLSDLHLQASAPRTFEAWRHLLLNTRADAVLLLGDVFEVWVGDDAVDHDPFLQACMQVLQAASAQRWLGFLPGNRDFLVGPAFLTRCGLHPLQDPTCLVWGKHRALLSHGDALCLDDVDYQRFRAVSRTSGWQQDFLAQPLAQRLALAQQMRVQSEAHNQGMQSFADADPDMTAQWLQAHDCHWLIHGHTHRPADHPLPGRAPGLRQVLSDWDAHAQPPRAQVLRLHADGRAQRLDPLSA